MKNLARRLALPALILLSVFSITVPVEGGANKFAAIAYSPSTGQYGYGNGYDSQATAMRRARNECGQSDARVEWCRNAWVALAISNRSAGGYGIAWATSANGARSAARKECLQHNPDARVVVCVSAYR